MPETITQNKILKYLVWGLVLLGIVVFVNSWLLKPKPLPPLLIPEPHIAIKIDFETLASQELQDLLPFEGIPFPEEIGRENPFSPY